MDEEDNEIAHARMLTSEKDGGFWPNLEFATDTRWFRENFRTPAGIFQSNLNKMDLLLGLHWRSF
jgi:hypothetical protein